MLLLGGRDELARLVGHVGDLLAAGQPRVGGCASAADGDQGDAEKVQDVVAVPGTK